MSLNGEIVSDERRAERGMEITKTMRAAIAEKVNQVRHATTGETSKYQAITRKLKETKNAAVEKIRSSFDSGAKTAENVKKGIKTTFWLKLTGFLCTVGAVIDPEPISKAAFGVGAVGSELAANTTETVAFIKKCKEIRTKHKQDKALRRQSLLDRVMFWKEKSPMSLTNAAARA